MRLTWRVRALSGIGVGWLTASCGGAVSTGPGDAAGQADANSCTTPSEPFGSLREISLARCANLPLDAKLVQLRSGPTGDMDAEGRSRAWPFVFWDEATKTSYGGVNTTAAPDYGPMTCGTDALVPISSESVVPDALQRFAAHDPYPDRNYRNYFFWQELACASAFQVSSNRVVILRPDPSNPQGPAPRWWDVYYDDAAHFVRLCGPCAATGDPACTPCYP